MNNEEKILAMLGELTQGQKELKQGQEKLEQSQLKLEQQIVKLEVDLKEEIKSSTSFVVDEIYRAIESHEINQHHA